MVAQYLIPVNAIKTETRKKVPNKWNLGMNFLEKLNEQNLGVDLLNSGIN